MSDNISKVCVFFVSALAFLLITAILSVLINDNDDTGERCQCAWVVGIFLYGVTVAFLWK